MELQARYAEIRSQGLGLAAFSYDAPALVKAFAASKKIQFPLLSDHDHSIVVRYGILNRQYEPGHTNYGIPHPGTFIVDRAGRVTARFFESEYQFRNTAASVALKIGEPLPGMGTAARQATPHLTVTTFLTDESAAPGHRFSIVLDVSPKAGMHVYAPGQHGYRVVTLKLEPHRLLRTYPVSYPKSTEYLFAPLNERVQVYEKSFRLLQDAAVVVNQETRQLAAKSGSLLTLKGVLAYQACTDKICFPPEEVPLTWAVALKPLQ